MSQKISVRNYAAASSGKRSVTLWRASVRLSVCQSRRRTERDSPGAACDAASVHFGPDNTYRTDIFVIYMAHKYVER